MLFLLVGVVLVLLKWQEIGPVATWSWWWVLLPLALAALWWAWSDHTGLTQQRAMDRSDERKRKRIDRNKAQLKRGKRP